jgi:ketosteroid isomerase-like protein
VHELPFSPTGSPIRFTRDQMRAAMATPRPARMIDRKLIRMEIEEAKDDATVLADYEIAGTLAETGEQVSIRGAMVVTTRGGLIARSRNYMNPDVPRRLNTPDS